MRISVVATVRNEARNLPALLESLFAQRPPFEVVLVDAYSDDNTWDLCRAAQDTHPDIVRAHRHGGSRAEGRNFGVSKAESDWVAFTDGDCIVSSHWLEGFRSLPPETRVAAGRTHLVGMRLFVDLPPVSADALSSRWGSPACNLLYRKDFFESLGGFDARLRTFEDVDLNFRAHQAGATIAYAPDAVVFARARDTFFDFARQMFWQGYGRRQFERKHGGQVARGRPPANFRAVTPATVLRVVPSRLGYFAAALNR